MQCVAGVAGLAGLFIPGCWCTPHHPLSPHDKMCRDKYGDWRHRKSGGEKTSEHVSFLIGGGDECPPSGCGLNGSWLGAGFRFRELRTDGKCSNLGLHLGAFSLNNEPLSFQIVGDEVQGITPKQEVLKGAQLKGAKLIIEHYNPRILRDGNITLTCDMRIERREKPDETYVMTFENITPQAPWAECVGACSPSKQITLYEFSVVNPEDQCNVELCQPGLNDDNTSGMKGTAAIFTGDVYDDKTYAVRDVTAPQDPDHAVFNVACLGTAVSKMHMFGHTAVASTSVTTTIPERQALLRLLTGDYCGVGKPFTVDGVPIRIDFANPKLKPSASSQYAITTDPASTQVDARWDQNGAVCVGTPRLSVETDPSKHVAKDVLMTNITKTCKDAPHTVDLTQCPLPANLATDPLTTSANP
jgi:hypothetical protein